MTEQPRPKKQPPPASLIRQFREIHHRALKANEELGLVDLQAIIQQEQRNQLNTLFEQCAVRLPAHILPNLGQQVAALEQLPTSQLNQAYLEALAQNEITTIYAMELPIDTNGGTLDADEIIGLPGFIKLHTVFREWDVAGDLKNLTTRSKGFGRGTPALAVDFTKSYEEGRSVAEVPYPELPPLPGAFHRQRKTPGGGFDI